MCNTRETVLIDCVKIHRARETKTLLTLLEINDSSIFLRQTIDKQILFYEDTNNYQLKIIIKSVM